MKTEQLTCATNRSLIFIINILYTITAGAVHPQSSIVMKINFLTALIAHVSDVTAVSDGPIIKKKIIIHNDNLYSMVHGIL